MTRYELERELNNRSVRRDAYSLDGGHPSEAYVLAYDGKRWRVYYSERGQETHRVEFENQSAACQYLLTVIANDPATQA